MSLRDNKHSDKPWIMMCIDNVRFYLSEVEYKRYINRRINSNRNWIVVIFEDGTEVMMSAIIAVMKNPAYVNPRLPKTGPVEEIDEDNKSEEEIRNKPTETTIDTHEHVDPEPVTVNQEKPETPVKGTKTREEEMLEELIARSNCTHEGKEVLYHQLTKTGDKYFPVCTFCGHRGRYIKQDALTTNEMRSAKEWVDN